MQYFFQCFRYLFSLFFRISPLFPLFPIITGTESPTIGQNPTFSHFSASADKKKQGSL